jgi:hypothetical protein
MKELLKSDDYYKILDLIQNSNSYDYDMLLKSLLNKYGILIDRHIARKYGLDIPYFEDYRFIQQLNKKFSKDMIELKWKYNELVLSRKWSLNNIMYIENNKLSFVWLIINAMQLGKNSVSDKEFSYLLNYPKESKLYREMIISNLIFYAEGFLVKNDFMNVFKFNKVFTEFCLRNCKYKNYDKDKVKIIKSILGYD